MAYFQQMDPIWRTRSYIREIVAIELSKGANTVVLSASSRNSLKIPGEKQKEQWSHIY